MTYVIAWFIWRRWFFMSWVCDWGSSGHQPGDRFHNVLSALHNNNVAGCRTHPVIYRDMCRIARG